jgi:hypothetical protein
MNPLEELHKTIDNSDWDVKDDSLINKLFQELNSELENSGQIDLLKKSEKEREVFNFSKTTEGIKWKFQGTKTFEDGTKEPFNWPDIATWENDDFEYILRRYREAKNLFAKSEYGCMLYLKGFLDPAECKELFNILLSLSKRYFEALKSDEKSGYYSSQYYGALAFALKIASYKKKAPGFSNEFDDAIRFAESIHKQWDNSGKYLLRSVIDMTDLAIQYYTLAKELIDFEGFYSRNNSASEKLSESYTWGGIYIIDENLKLAEIIGKSQQELIKRKAILFEKLASEALQDNRELPAISFIETALRLYMELNDSENIERLEKEYTQVRGTGNFKAIEMEMPDEYTTALYQNIQKEINEGTPESVLDNFVWGSMYKDIQGIKIHAEEWKKNAVLMFMIGSTISDKFGNTIARYPGGSDEWAFIQSYSLQFQLGTQILIFLFLESFKAGILSEESTIKLLKNSWMNIAIPRNYNNNKIIVIPLDLVKPSITAFFEELNKWKEKGEYTFDLIMITDSLILKIEAMLRLICEKISIPTFRTRDDGLVMERNLDEILASLEEKPEQKTNFDENDRRFIKYFLTEKAGENLRNRVAHGLMDASEYTIEKVIIAFHIILRLTKYQFKTENYDVSNL